MSDVLGGEGDAGELSSALRRSNARYIQAAREQYQRDGEIEIDDNAVVSRGDDPGAYVQAWVWVYKSDLPKRKRKAGRADLTSMVT